MTNGGGSGKCTFEVVIDGAVDVEIRGAEGRLRWVGGGGMSWRRLDCNQPLPRNPNNFRFQGIDGRGTQTLIKDPRNNNGVAVIRVDDPQRGSEGYTGDITWDGGSDSGGNWDRDRDNWNDRDNRDNWQGNWGGRAVSSCQNAVRDQAGSRYGDGLDFYNSPSSQRAGSVVVVQGIGSFRDRRGPGYMQYSCVVRPNGNVVDVKYSPVDDR